MDRACKKGDWEGKISNFFFFFFFTHILTHTFFFFFFSSEILNQIKLHGGPTRASRKSFVNKKDHNGSTALFHCAWYCHSRAMSVLLFYGAEVNRENNRGNTCMHLAVEQNSKKILSLLLYHGAEKSLYVKNWKGKTPIDIAMEKNNNQQNSDLGKVELYI